MKLGFRPMTKNDWRLLLTLAKCLRLATKEDLARVVQRWEQEQRAEQAPASYYLAGFRIPTP